MGVDIYEGKSGMFMGVRFFLKWGYPNFEGVPKCGSHRNVFFPFFGGAWGSSGFDAIWQFGYI